MQSRVRSVCVYCGSSHGVRPSFDEAATRLGQQLAAAGIRLVYGGGAVGLMGVVAQSVLDSGGQVTGIIPDFLDRAEVGKTDLTELIKTETMHDRKAIMAERSDGFVVLPGGLGTLDETFEILTWKQLQLHNKPIVLVNVEGYWDHFVHLVEHQVREGFVRERYLQFFRVVDTVEEVVPALLEDAAAAMDQSDRLDRA
ncbi:MAG: TIGR00730 family Rossman fold protein [Alphaproteobacteria bacterium]|nr:TIGR00730 family Rossman fold protein [Alphaproteobacteria bacterium]